MDTNATPPNIVLVSIDSLRADHCGFLGDDRGLTPTMDALADDGVAYRNAIAPGPQTFSSMPAVFTGTHRPVYEPDDDGTSHWERQLLAIDRHLERFGSVAEKLQELGYATAGFSPNPWTSRSSNWDRGFDHFSDLTGKADGRLDNIVGRLPGVDADRRAVRLAIELLSGSSFFAQWDSFYDDLTALREELPEPYFLWVFLLDTHFPFITTRAYREEQSLFATYASNVRAGRAMRGGDVELSSSVRESIRRSYRDTVRAADGFFTQLRADASEDDPVLFVHSDHGESFGEHGNYGHHHAKVYEENVHVPYFVHNAGVTADVEAPTSLATIHDSVLATARRGTFDPWAASDSVAFAKSVHGTRRTARQERFKYVEIDDRRMLFDLEHDPTEQDDQSAERLDRRRELERSLSVFDEHVEETERLVNASKAVVASDDR